jgi:hypothetical protein
MGVSASRSVIGNGKNGVLSSSQRFFGGCSYIQAQVQYIKMAPSGGATETDAVRSTLKRPADTHMYAVLAWFSIQ